MVHERCLCFVKLFVGDQLHGTFAVIWYRFGCVFWMLLVWVQNEYGGGDVHFYTRILGFQSFSLKIVEEPNWLFRGI